MSKADAAEGAKSNVLTRCCKDLGVARDLWKPTFVRDWLSRYALEETHPWKKRKDKNGKEYPMKVWRKKTAAEIADDDKRRGGLQSEILAKFGNAAADSSPVSAPQGGDPCSAPPQGADGVMRGHEPAESAAPAASPATSPATITAGQVAHLWIVARRAVGGDDAKAKARVKAALTAAGYEHTKDISPDDYVAIRDVLAIPPSPDTGLCAACGKWKVGLVAGICERCIQKEGEA